MVSLHLILYLWRFKLEKKNHFEFKIFTSVFFFKVEEIVQLWKEGRLTGKKADRTARELCRPEMFAAESREGDVSCGWSNQTGTHHIWQEAEESPDFMYWQVIKWWHSGDDDNFHIAAKGEK